MKVQMTGVTISIVNHNNSQMINALLLDIAKSSQVERVVLIDNLGEDHNILVPALLNAKVTRIVNKTRMGFGANHNIAFHRCDSEFFLVLNPDIRFSETTIPTLLKKLQNAEGACIAPLVRNLDGSVQQSYKFPLISMFKRLLFYRHQSS